MSLRQHHAPGARVEIRDAEWRIRRVDYSSDGGYVLTCEGLSELVRGREALFLTRLETIRVLDPNETELVDDTSSNFAASLLYIDSLLRKTAPSDERIHLGHRAAIDELDFQLEPALQALRQPRQRILIADAVGLGKTLKAGILVSDPPLQEGCARAAQGQLPGARDRTGEMAGHAGRVARPAGRPAAVAARSPARCRRGAGSGPAELLRQHPAARPGGVPESPVAARDPADVAVAPGQGQETARAHLLRPARHQPVRPGLALEAVY